MSCGNGPRYYRGVSAPYYRAEIYDPPSPCFPAPRLPCAPPPCQPCPRPVERSRGYVKYKKEEYEGYEGYDQRGYYRGYY